MGGGLNWEGMLGALRRLLRALGKHGDVVGALWAMGYPLNDALINRSR